MRKFEYVAEGPRLLYVGTNVKKKDDKIDIRLRQVFGDEYICEHDLTIME